MPRSWRGSHGKARRSIVRNLKFAVPEEKNAIFERNLRYKQIKNQVRCLEDS